MQLSKWCLIFYDMGCENYPPTPHTLLRLCSTYTYPLYSSYNNRIVDIIISKHASLHFWPEHYLLSQKINLKNCIKMAVLCHHLCLVIIEFKFGQSRFKIRKAKKIWGTREKSSRFPYKIFWPFLF